MPAMYRALTLLVAATLSGQWINEPARNERAKISRVLGRGASGCDQTVSATLFVTRTRATRVPP